ncbi:MAG: hypothetical protein EOP87_23475 [Verrucomicrobiaceae bacterium]|nr:MAG: hypothetical protein EOP87_23475 [Verrucomicrobiaceae bacterium]
MEFIGSTRLRSPLKESGTAWPVDARSSHAWLMVTSLLALGVSAPLVGYIQSMKPTCISATGPPSLCGVLCQKDVFAAAGA